MSEEEYQRLKSANDRADPLTAFVGFACSFGGKWWGGYARQPQTGHNFARAGSRSIRQRVRANVEHVAADGLTWAPEASPAVVYCDPPYEGTTGYGAVQQAEVGAWWWRLATFAAGGATCYLSEYAETAPDGIAARLVWEAPSYKPLAHDHRNRERLWRVLPSPA